MMTNCLIHGLSHDSKCLRCAYPRSFTVPNPHANGIPVRDLGRFANVPGYYAGNESVEPQAPFTPVVNSCGDARFMALDPLANDQEAREMSDADKRAWMNLRPGSITRHEKAMMLPIDPAARKNIPIGTGVLDYFPLALAEVARVSKAGNDQHNPGQPLHWDKTKSMDHADCIPRHFIDRLARDTDGQRHSAKLAWRALAMLQIELEAEAAK